MCFSVFCLGGVEAGQGRDVSQQKNVEIWWVNMFFLGLLKGDKVSCLRVCLFVCLFKL